MVKMLDLVGLPKNINGYRTTHTCELCGFEPKTKNKYREKQDHLVMKHFKDKIDKIFPHCRPYTCPTPECEFTGKDKQALLRHYTGKHGILEQFLREALSEKGINYAPGDHPKRKSSTETRKNRASPSRTTAGATIMVPTHSIVNPKDLLPSVPLSSASIMSAQQHGTNKPNNEELRREVEAMMASFQPQPISTTAGQHLTVSQPPLVVSLPHIPTLSLVNSGIATNGMTTNGLLNGSNGIKTEGGVLTTHPVPMSIALPTVPVQNVSSIAQQGMPKLTQAASLPMTPLPPMSVILPQEPAKLMDTPTSNTGRLPSLISNGRIIKTSSSNVQLMRRSPPGIMDTMPDLIMPMAGHNGDVPITLPSLPTVLAVQQNPSKLAAKLGRPMPMTIDAMNGPRNSVASDPDSTPPSSIVMDDPSEMNADQTVVLENEEVMWSAPHGGPAVVVEVADTVPVSYIHQENVVQGGLVTAIASESYATTTPLDNMEYDYLYTNGGTTHDQVRERQLDFCML